MIFKNQIRETQINDLKCELVETKRELVVTRAELTAMRNRIESLEGLYNDFEIKKHQEYESIYLQIAQVRNQKDPEYMAEIITELSDKFEEIREIFK